MTLTKLIELQAAATEGPWEAFTDSYAPTRVLNHKKTICHVIGDSAETDDTAAYIAAARNFDFAALDEKVRQMEQDIGKLVIQRETMKEALRFYADNWQSNSTGDQSVPGGFLSWEEPNDDLMNDEGNRARAALEGME